MIAVQSIHMYDDAKVAEVMDEMRILGSPTIRICMVDDDTARALEGVHRLEAAHRLGLIPRLEVVGRDALVADLGLDWQDGDADSTVGDMLDWFDSRGRVYYV